jgi:hypothetical protein
VKADPARLRAEVVAIEIGSAAARRHQQVEIAVAVDVAVGRPSCDDRSLKLRFGRWDEAGRLSPELKSFADSPPGRSFEREWHPSGRDSLS